MAKLYVLRFCNEKFIASIGLGELMGESDTPENAVTRILSNLSFVIPHANYEFPVVETLPSKRYETDNIIVSFNGIDDNGDKILMEYWIMDSDFTKEDITTIINTQEESC